jgi:acyl carrier protein
MTQTKVETLISGSITDPAIQAGNEQPNSSSEKYMAALWLEVIGLDQIWLSDKFLDVGGNSLTLNIILKRIEKEKGAALPARQFFDSERSSLFEIARELDRLSEAMPNRAQ